MMSPNSLAVVRLWAMALAVALSLTSLSVAAVPNKKATIVFADFSERSGILFVAKDQRFFEEQGLDAEPVQVRSGPIAISALAAGEAQFYTVSATGALGDGRRARSGVHRRAYQQAGWLFRGCEDSDRGLERQNSACKASAAASGCLR
jgi:ABC-type proline/glycine betaine transport system substrate-binding protein